MAQVAQKVCRVCGTNVAQQKRTKDTLGNYYCQPCYEKSQTTEPTADDLFTCPTCNGRFNRDGMDDSGVCKDCNAAKPTASDTCESCGAPIGNDAAFCARCGAKQHGRLSTDDEIDVTSIIAHLRRYAELNTALMKAPDAERQYKEVRPQMIAAGAVQELAELDFLFTKAQADKKQYIAECEDLKKRLQGFNESRVETVRRLILDNATVDDSIKAGVRLDLFGVFGPPNTPSVLAAVSHNRSAAALTPTTALPPNKSEFMNGVWSKPTKRATKRTISPKPLIVGFLCLISAGAIAGKSKDFPALFAFSVLLSLGGVATMLAWGVIAIVRKLSPTAAEGAAEAEQSVATSKAEGRPFPVGLYIAVGMVLIGAILSILAIRRLLTATPPSSDDISFVVVNVLLGVVLVVVGFITWSGACPKCLLLFTSEILDSEHLGTHMETRNESRVARHYDARGGPAQSETRYEVAIPVSVTTSRHTRHCKACGHIWQTTSQTRT